MRCEEHTGNRLLAALKDKLGVAVKDAFAESHVFGRHGCREQRPEKKELHCQDNQVWNSFHEMQKPV